MRKEKELHWKGTVNIDPANLEYKEDLLAILENYTHMWDGRFGNVKAAKHRINLVPGAKPVFQPHNRAGPKERELEKMEIDKMKESGVIQPSTSERAAPIVFAPKKDGTLRFCIDYRRLNLVTIRDSYPIPRMDECIDSLGHAEIFSTLD